MGTYDVGSNTIFLNENLSEVERAETLKHELMHAHFFTETALGRFVGLFFKKKVIPFYVALVCLALLLSPLVCCLFLLPAFIAGLQELYVCVKVSSLRSFAVSAFELVAACVLLWLRVVWL